ncbi:hypothetical protein lerEdw1_011161, partial [Lerista edwardsae]
MGLAGLVLQKRTDGPYLWLSCLLVSFLQEDERVQAAAIEHLCCLRSKLPSPPLMGDALSEFVHILLHVDEEEVVATDPWTTQMAVLRALRSAADRDIIPELMDLVETILPGLLSGETFDRLLANIYIQHMAHEDERVRVAAIQHLGRLRSKLRGPPLMGDALSELISILLHVDEEEVVATAAKAALTQLVPEVPWKVDPEDYTLHQVLDQAVRYLAAKAALTQLLPEVKWKVALEQYTVHQILDQAAKYL